MPVEIVKQDNFNVGELDPLVAPRADLKVYYAGLALAENVVTTPLGALTRRPGSAFIDYVRHILAPVDFTVDMVLTAGAGGTAADAVSADGTLFTTTDALGAGDQVLIEVSFGVPTEVHLIDLIDYAVVDGGGSGASAAVPPAPPSYAWPPPAGTPGTASDFGGETQLP